MEITFLPTNTSEIHLHVEQFLQNHKQNRLVVAKGEGLGEGWSGRLKLADVSFYV